MTAFTNSIPAPSHTLAADQPLMLANNQYLQTSVGVDHNFTANTGTAEDGHHKIIHFLKQAGDPGPTVNIGQLYTKTVGADVQLFWLSGAGTPEQLSASAGGTPGGDGFVYLPGGIIMQWGGGSVSASGTATPFVFPLVGGFPTNLFSITIGCRTGEGNSPGENNQFIKEGSQTLTGFSIVNSSGSAARKIYYIAIGN